MRPGFSYNPQQSGYT